MPARTQTQMMEESPEEAAKRENMLKMYHACKESLQIIGKYIKIVKVSSSDRFSRFFPQFVCPFVPLFHL